MALIHFLANRSRQFGIEVAAVHVDHMLRGEESKKDLEYVRSYCEKNNIPFFFTSIDIRQKMKLDKKGMQETAREYRYLFFAEVMKQWGANKLAVGQHADDQMETILMRLARGSSGKARAGIRAARPFSEGMIIRPLLGATKEQVEAYCDFHELKPRKDPSNERPDYTRNRYRLEILPVLKKENERVHEHFQRFSEDILEDEAFLEKLAKQQLAKVSEKAEREIRVRIPAFLNMPLPLQRRGIHLILSYLYKKNIDMITSRHVSSIGRLFKGENPSGKLDLPLGLHVIRSYETCLFTFEEEERPTEYHYDLQEGEEIFIPGHFAIQLKKDNMPIRPEDDYIQLDPSAVTLPLIVRTRVPGDRMTLKGMGGNRKIKDIFIDEKIPLEKRDSWPIIADASGRILWIPGVKKSCFDLSPKMDGSYYICIAKQPGRQQSQ
jgi:tRNA(Ile)-lysidine synthase